MRLQPTHREATLALQAILIAELVFALWRQQWFVSFITAGIVAVTLVPLLLERRFRVHIPPQFQLLAIGFVFASLFLGEVHGYYARFWWWDIALHAMSGFLLGIVGFLLVHLLNETEEIGIHMKPGFVAFFAFLFALGVGVLWELFEFAMDTFFGMNMQKAMLGDPSGLIDTMLDLLVDALGALVITTYGYVHLSVVGRDSFLRRWISAFIRHNPGLFRR
ncbi:MAG: hypothetical protein U5K33_02570 [Halofilum sp. (in: g-proteobacteria)]|nr:hypothetical protein [Halofilum sp. (in: g-proteobacteria)]